MVSNIKSSLDFYYFIHQKIKCYNHNIGDDALDYHGVF